MGKMCYKCMTWENGLPVVLTNQLQDPSLYGAVSALSYALRMPVFCQCYACFHSDDSVAPTHSTSR